MDNLKWIMSEGGPLIAMDSVLQNSWGGVFRLTTYAPGAQNDYERPPSRLNYLQTINLENGKALIFGEGPLDTAFWQSPHGCTFIVRAMYCESNFNASATLENLDWRIFEKPYETLDFEFLTEKVVMFDSAEDGTHPEIEAVTTSIKPGQYRILTQIYKPDQLTSLVLHRFDRIDKNAHGPTPMPTRPSKPF